MIIILKDKRVEVPEGDLKYLEGVKQFFNCDIDGFRNITADEFINVLSIKKLLSDGTFKKHDGKTFRLK